MNVELAHRVVAGATAGRLLLTLPEATELLDYLATNPRASVIVNEHPVEIAALPVTVLDAHDLGITLDPDPWARNVLASWCEGIIDADDADRLLRRQDPTP